MNFWWAHHDSNLSIPSNLHLLWTPPNRPEQHKRPDSGRFDTVQINSVPLSYREFKLWTFHAAVSLEHVILKVPEPFCG